MVCGYLEGSWAPSQIFLRQSKLVTDDIWTLLGLCPKCGLCPNYVLIELQYSTGPVINIHSPVDSFVGIITPHQYFC